jgi:non-ribosomal peptide synthetase component F
MRLQIDAASSRIANHLLAAGVGPGSIIGVLLLRSPNIVATLLAVLKVGAAYLPLDHHHPESRIALMLEDAAVKVRACLAVLLQHAAVVQQAAAVIMAVLLPCAQKEALRSCWRMLGSK